MKTLGRVKPNNSFKTVNALPFFIKSNFKTQKPNKASEKRGLLSNVFDWARNNADFIKIVGAIGAALYGLVQYQAKSYLDTVKSTQDIVEKFRASDEYRSLVKLQDEYLSEDFSKLRSKLSRGLITSADYHRYVKHKVLKDFRSQFMSANRGLKSISICAIQGQCETDTICMHLSRTMQDFRCDFRSVIASISSDDGSCAVDELNYFLDTYCQPWLSSYLGVSYSNITDNSCLYDKDSRVFHIGNACASSIIFKRKSNIFKAFVKQ